MRLPGSWEALTGLNGGSRILSNHPPDDPYWRIIELNWTTGYPTRTSLRKYNEFMASKEGKKCLKERLGK